MEERATSAAELPDKPSLSFSTRGSHTFR